VRQGELRLRAAWSSRTRAAVFVDPVGARQPDQGRQLASGEVEKVRRELAGYQQFAALTEQIVEMNEAIREARPAAAPAAGDPPG